MAIGPTFEPQIGPLGIVGAFQQGQSHQMSMMERAQSVKQQKLRTQMLEAQRQQWELEAPIRNAQLQTGLADAANQLYAAQELSKATAEVTSRGPEFMQMMKDADIETNTPDGLRDYEANWMKWSDVAQKLSPYAHTAKGKQWMDVANMKMAHYQIGQVQQNKFKTGKLEQEYKIAELQDRHAARMEELKARGGLVKDIQDGKLVYRDPETGEVAPYRGAYQTVEEKAAGAYAEESAKQKAKTDMEYISGIRTAAENSYQDSSSVGSMLMLLRSGSAETGYGQSAVNTFVSMLDRAGIPVDTAQLSNNQYLEQQMSLLKVRMASQLMRGQGQITEKEREMLEKATANVNWSRETNIKILQAMFDMMQRSKQLNNMANAMEADGKSQGEIRMALEAYKADNDKSFDLGEPIASPNEVKAISSRADFDALPNGAKFNFNGRIGVKR